MIKDLIKSKDRVEYILSKYPEARDSDKVLWLAYLVIYHDLRKVLGEPSYESFKKIILDKETCTMESIRRVRQKFQESGNYVGTKRNLKLIEESLVREYVKDS